MRHLTAVTETVCELSNGVKVRIWDVKCACGWESAPQSSRKLAGGAAAAHRASAAAREE